MITYTTRQGDMLDWICWKHYGQQASAVEAVLEANRHLAAQGPVYPAGLTLVLPELQRPKPQETVRLWD